MVYKVAFQDKFNVEKYDGVVYLTALESYQSLGQERRSAFVEEESYFCFLPMLDAQAITPSIKSLDPDPNTCGHLKTTGSQTPLINDGFNYSMNPYVDNYILFRRDFYGQSRMSTTNDAGVGAFN